MAQMSVNDLAGIDTTESEILEKFPENTGHIKDFKAA